MLTRAVLLCAALSSGWFVTSGQTTSVGFQPDPRATALVQQMTLDEKIEMLSGGSMMGTKALPRLHIPVSDVCWSGRCPCPAAFDCNRWWDH